MTKLMVLMIECDEDRLVCLDPLIQQNMTSSHRRVGVLSPRDHCWLQWDGNTLITC